MYRYCKLFSCSPEEYERRPFKESVWLLEIDSTWNEAVQQANEKASKQSG